MAGWTKDYDPQLVAHRIDESKSIDGGGNIAFESVAHSEGVVVLNSMLRLDPQVPDIEKLRIVDQATFSAARLGTVTAKSILREAAKLERLYMSSPLTSFRLVTDISISRTCPMRSVQWRGSRITFRPYLSSALLTERNKLVPAASHMIAGELPENYTSAIVSVTARTAAEATDTAMKRLDLIRGTWNFWRNFGRWFRMSSGRRNPVNEMVGGPLHTLHTPKGTLATKTWWYEPNYQGPIATYDPKEKLDKMYAYSRDLRERLKRNPYGDDVELALVRYVRALDSRDLDDAFLSLWGVLEFLTATGTDGYKTTVRRASFMFDDREYAYQVLLHLRDHRNRTVHAGSESLDTEPLVYQLKRYVEVLLRFHIANSFRFRSLSDAAEFMNLPSDRCLIDQRIMQLRRALQFKFGA